MRIAVCDDSKDDLLRISSQLNRYKAERNPQLTYKTFNNGLEMLEKTKSGDYDLYLLDVLMPALNGMEVAKEIRTFDNDAKIVFLTSSPEYAVESYRVKAMDYLLKPVEIGRLFLVLDELFSDIINAQNGISVKTKKGLSRILFSRLAYVEVINKQVFFNLSDNSIREVTGQLAEFEPALLSRPEFMKIHRSYIVNLYEINLLQAKNLITHQGKTLPISRALYKNVRDRYMALLFGERG